jgi:hypothetical protein
MNGVVTASPGTLPIVGSASNCAMRSHSTTDYKYFVFDRDSTWPSMPIPVKQATEQQSPWRGVSRVPA